MSLRNKLALLHIAFATFSVGVSGITIYGVQLYIYRSVSSLEQIVDESLLIDQVRIDGHRQVIALHDVLAGRREPDASYHAERDAYFARLKEAARYSSHIGAEQNSEQLLDIVRAFESELSSCLTDFRNGEHDKAFSRLHLRVDEELRAKLDTQLTAEKRRLEQDRQRSVDRVLATSNRIIEIVAIIGGSCIIFVLVGMRLLRRWFLDPVVTLKRATQEFAQGNLAHRVKLDTGDELGLFATALNEMAESVQATQAKYRSLFENLRDAIIICDAAGTVVECRDSDSDVLGISAVKVSGQHIQSAWANGRSSTLNWNHLIERVANDKRAVRANDVVLSRRDGEERSVDVVAYPVAYSGLNFVAISLRDVTERNRLEKLARRADAIEATETFARGIAHDFKNLLNSAMSTLSLAASEAETEQARSRFDTATAACGQAASLANRLLRFSASGVGRPQIVNLSETIELILSSLDEDRLAQLSVQTELDRNLCVLIDKDQLTQIVLNLVGNACEAMPDGGTLTINVAEATAVHPLRKDGPQRFAKLVVADTGMGMPDSVKKRVFEPLFSTRSKQSDTVRGMGLAIVYSAVRHANGLIHIESEVQVGTSVHVFLPIAHAGDASDEAPPASPDVHPDAS